MLRERRQFSGMQRVILLDELGEQFGAVHEYHGLRMPVDAIKLLSINYPDFSKHLIESGKRGVGYKVVQSETELTLDDMLLPFGSKDLIIAPVIGGSGDGWGQTIAGVALIGLAIAVPGVGIGVGASGGSWFGAAAGTTVLGSAAVASAVAVGGNIGIALTMRGMSTLLAEATTPMQAAGDTSTNTGLVSTISGGDGIQSYAYSGAANSVGAGATIPVCFGKALIGSHIIAADIDVEDTSDPIFDPDDPDPSEGDVSYGGGWISQPNIDDTTVQGQILTNSWTETSGIQSRRISNGSISGGTQYLDSPVTINLASTSRQTISPFIRGEWGSGNAYRTKYFIICFELGNGLYHHIGNSNSTKIAGYVQFKIIIYSREAGRDVTIIPVTVQGMFEASKSYKWAHWFEYAKIRNKDWYDVVIQVDDYSAYLDVNTFTVKQYGYRYIDGART